MLKSLLERQIWKYLSDFSPTELSKMDSFFVAVSDAYRSFEDDRILMERSLDISSSEMLEKNEILQKNAQENENIIHDLLESISKLDTWSSFKKKKHIDISELTSYLVKLIRRDKKNIEKIIQQEKDTKKLNIELQKFQLAVENASDYISIVDLEKKVVFMNSSLLEATGFTRKEVINKPLYTTIRRHEDIQKIQNIYSFLEREWEWIQEELVTNRKNGSQFISDVSFTPIFNSKNIIVFFLIIERDITKEKEVDAMKDEFLSIASHELRTPMTVINGYNELLLSGTFGSITEQQKKYLQRIESNINNLINIVNDMLDIGKLESGKIKFQYESFNIHDLLDEVYSFFRRICESKGLSISYSSDDIEVYLDREKIKQVLNNLISNAYKFTEKGSISISTEILEWDTLLRVSITDSWVGIAEENKIKLFKKFSQVDNYLQKTQKGTGLGLSICKTIIEWMNGKIDMKSCPDTQGSIFYFDIPYKK